MGKAIARGSKKAIVQECFKDAVATKHVLDHLSNILRREMKTMVSDNAGSVLRSQEIESMQNLSWDFVIQELSVHAPNLLQLLHSITSTKTDRDNQKAIIGMCASIMLKHLIQNESGPEDHIHYSVCWTYIKAGKHDCNMNWNH